MFMEFKLFLKYLFFLKYIFHIIQDQFVMEKISKLIAIFIGEKEIYIL